MAFSKRIMQLPVENLQEKKAYIYIGLYQ